MDNINRNMETLRKNQEEMWEFKNIVIKIKNVFEGFICRLDIAEGRISELEDISTEIFQTEVERTCNLSKCVRCSKNSAWREIHSTECTD